MSTHVGSQTTYAEPGHVIPPLGTGTDRTTLTVALCPPQGAFGMTTPAFCPKLGPFSDAPAWISTTFNLP